MNDMIQLLFYILNKYWDFMFTTELVSGVSLGMFYIVIIMFGILMKFFVAVPKVMPRKRDRYYDVYKNNEFNGYDHYRHKYK